NRCHRQNMKTSIINGSEVSRLSVAIQRVESSKPNGDDTQTLSLVEYSDDIYLKD
ncbi:integrase, partial [Cronobacter dublinensis]|nr:integrase [Cronobacter dublinensis]